MQLAFLPGRDVAVPVRFGGSASPSHGLMLRFGPAEHDGTVPGHLIARVGQEHLAARQSLAAVVDGFRRTCDNERIAVAVTRAALSPAVEARMVELTTPDGGSCFGQPGQNSYLLAKAGGGWRRLLSAEPGSITALNSQHGGYADLELNSLGTCVYKYRWTGGHYVQAGSHDCATGAPPTIGTLPRAIRGRP